MIKEAIGQVIKGEDLDYDSMKEVMNEKYAYTMIELMNDRAMELPPLNQFLARSLIDRARVSETLGEWRGATAVDMDALEHVLLRVSENRVEPLPEQRLRQTSAAV